MPRAIPRQDQLQHFKCVLHDKEIQQSLWLRHRRFHTPLQQALPPVAQESAPLRPPQGSWSPRAIQGQASKTDWDGQQHRRGHCLGPGTQLRRGWWRDGWRYHERRKGEENAGALWFADEEQWEYEEEHVGLQVGARSASVQDYLIECQVFEDESRK